MTFRKPLKRAKIIKISRDKDQRSKDWETPTTALTRYSKAEYELRRDFFQETYPSRSYDDEVTWGTMGGRPRKWANEAERKRASRLFKQLNPTVITKIGRPRLYHPHRAANAAERVKRHRMRIKQLQEQVNGKEPQVAKTIINL